MTADDLKRTLGEGDLDRSIGLAVEQVRKDPGNTGSRSMLFQISAIVGDWDRAEKQLDMVGTLDAAALDFVQDYKAAIAAERTRARVMAGDAPPSVFGDPPPWIAGMVEALRMDSLGEDAAAHDLRNGAMEQATAVPGTADDMPFSWIADADQRFGPVIECVLNGEYHWVPMETVAKLEFEPPRDLRDLVWSVGIVTFTNGGSWPLMVPTRYPGSEYRVSEEAPHAMARRTDWRTLHESHAAGIGQRMFATDDNDVPLLDLRLLTLESVDTDGEG